MQRQASPPRHPTAAEPDLDQMREAFARGTGGLQLRAHQLHTLQALSAMIRKDCKKRRATNYLLQHSTGSGKSLTMAALVYRLLTIEDKLGQRFHTVLLLTDRVGSPGKHSVR